MIFFQKNTSHEFVYGSYFEKLEKSECCGAIIVNIYYANIFVPEEQYRTIKNALNNVLRFF